MAIRVEMKDAQNNALNGSLKKMGMKIIAIEGQLFPVDKKDATWLYLTASKIESLHLEFIKSILVWRMEMPYDVIRGKNEERLLSILQNVEKVFYYASTSKLDDLEVEYTIIDSFPFKKSSDEILVELDLHET